jgi:hypothetical protein
MIQFFKNLFKGKESGPVAEAPYKVEEPAAKVEAVNAQPVSKKPVNNAAAPVPKKRTFVKRDEGGVAKVAAVKKPRAPKAK